MDGLGQLIGPSGERASMNIALSLIALAAAVAATFFADPNRDEPRGAEARSIFSPIRILTLLLLPALAALASLWLKTKVDGMMDGAIGLAVGVLVAIVAEALDRGPEAVGPMALAVAASAAIHSLGKDSLEHGQLGLAIGLGLGAWMVSVGGRGRGAARAAVIGIAAIAGDALGARMDALAPAALSGTEFALLAVVAGLIVNTLLRKANEDLLRGGLVVALLAGGAYALGKSLGHVYDAWMIFLIASVTGAVVHLLVGPEDKPDSFRFLLGCLIWLGAATASFTQAQSYGMATALVGAAAVPLLLGNTRALLTLGPLGALVLYRLFHQIYTEDVKALDIGQHYTLIGFALGAVVPLLGIEWGSSSRASGARGAIAGLLWAVLLLTAPIFVAIMLSAKGLIGFLFGLGFASVIDGLRGSRRVESLGVALSLAAGTILSYGWLDPLLDLERKDKQKYLITYAIAVAVVAVIITVLSLRSPQREEAAA